MFYDVDFLFQQLLKRGNESMNLLTVGAAEAYLTRDVYLYTSTVSCEYHANVESTVSKLNEQVKKYRYLLLMNKKKSCTIFISEMCWSRCFKICLYNLRLLLSVV